VGAGASLRQKIKDITGRDELVLEYEEIKKSDRVNSVGRACYVERNQWMIESSNFVVIRYKQIQAKKKESGTDCALQYAKKLQKNIIFIVVNGD
jgi:hypothetical protein